MFGQSLINKWFNNRRARLSLVTLLGLSFLLTLVLAMEGLNNFSSFESLSTILLLIGSLASVILLALIILNLRDLFLQMRRGRAGAMLTSRIVLLYLILAILPALVVYYFSLNFLGQRLDSLFSQRHQVEAALNNAQALHEAVLDAQKSAALGQLQQLIDEISPSRRDLIPLQVSDVYSRSEAIELNILDDAGVPIAVGVDANNPEATVSQPEDDILLRMKQIDTHVGIEFSDEDALLLRVLVKLPAEDGVNYFLVNALYPTVERPNELSAVVAKAADEYKQLLYLRESVETSFILLLSMVSVLSVFMASWLAFYFARHLSAPIRDLAAGTRAVANGQYDKQLPMKDYDELGFLVESFNEMTQKIRLASDSAKASQYIADAQRTYLEAVLNHLSSGVLALDHMHCLSTVNASASNILEAPLLDHFEESFAQICETYPNLQSLWEAIEPHVNSDNAHDWQVELVLFGAKGRKILMCRGANLPTLFDSTQPGHVIVFDDIT
ncbi:MAG: HAMP domain-containing protein, partial [Pseudomonadota bacterium]